jgi:hypothetical protein
MGKLVHFISLRMMLTGVLLVFQRQAFAYTDPGTGLLAIQAAGSALVAAGWVLRRKVSSLFHRRTTENTAPTEGDAGREGDSTVG